VILNEIHPVECIGTGGDPRRLFGVTISARTSAGERTMAFPAPHVVTSGMGLRPGQRTADHRNGVTLSV
jgi:hypothetical protein